MAGYWSARILTEPNDSGVIDKIYLEAVEKSDEAFLINGGVKDSSSISLGQGSKIRIWDYFGPNYNCKYRERVGKIGDGGKWLCGVSSELRNKAECIIYSVGSKGEISFEKGIEEKLPHCEIHIFDPTLTDEQKNNVYAFLHKSELHEIGLGESNGEFKIGNRKVLWTQKTKSAYQMKTLTTLMSELGHTWLDVLKIDIEGGEWNVFESLFATMHRIPATQIQIELHFLGDVNSVLRFFTKMRDKGFRVFSVEPNYYGRTAENARLMIEYSFIQVDEYGSIVWRGP
jgi:hypothetical protein